VINITPVVFVFSIHKVVRPVAADKIENFAQHPKR